MKDGNYYTVYGWMLNQLKLKGTKLQVFAVIYGFSRKEKACSGSLQYLAEATGCTKQTVLNALQALEEKHYIRKEQIRAKDGGVRNHYTAAPEILARDSNFQQSVETVENHAETSHKEANFFTPGVKKLECPPVKIFERPQSKN